jgi:hypothetical protein
MGLKELLVLQVVIHTLILFKHMVAVVVVHIMMQFLIVVVVVAVPDGQAHLVEREFIQDQVI